MAMKESTKEMIRYLQAHYNEDVTAGDVAAAIGATEKSVIAGFTTSLQNKKLGYREESPDKVTKSGRPLKYLRLNEQGLALDVDSIQGE